MRLARHSIAIIALLGANPSAATAQAYCRIGYTPPPTSKVSAESIARGILKSASDQKCVFGDDLHITAVHPDIGVSLMFTTTATFCDFERHIDQRLLEGRFSGFNLICSFKKKTSR